MSLCCDENGLTDKQLRCLHNITQKIEKLFASESSAPSESAFLCSTQVMPLLLTYTNLFPARNQKAVAKLFNSLATVDCKTACENVLSDAIDHANLYLLGVCLLAGASPNKQFGDRYYPMLCQAALKDSFDACNMLIKAGASVNLPNFEGVTPLMLAKSDDVVNLLLDSGADHTARDCGGNTAAHDAVGRIDDNLSKLLILHKSGADVDAKNCRGETVLTKAIQNRQSMSVRFLLALGISPCELAFKATDALSPDHPIVEMVSRYSSCRDEPEPEDAEKDKQTPRKVAFCSSVMPKQLLLQFLALARSNDPHHQAALDAIQRVNGDMRHHIVADVVCRAAQRHDWHLLSCLIAIGADPNTRCLYNDNESLLRLALCTQRGSETVAAQLISVGVAHVHNVMHQVVAQGQNSLLKLIIEKNPTVSVDRGLLDCAIEAGHVDVAKTLIGAGADITAYVREKIASSAKYVEFTPLVCAARTVSLSVTDVSGNQIASTSVSSHSKIDALKNAQTWIASEIERAEN